MTWDPALENLRRASQEARKRAEEARQRAQATLAALDRIRRTHPWRTMSRPAPEAEEEQGAGEPAQGDQADP